MIEENDNEDIMTTIGRLRLMDIIRFESNLARLILITLIVFIMMSVLNAGKFLTFQKTAHRSRLQKAMQQYMQTPLMA